MSSPLYQNVVEENIETGKMKESGPFLLHDSGGDEGFMGMRFAEQQIPKGAIIDSAFIQFTVNDEQGVINDPLTVTFVGESTAFAEAYDKEKDFDIKSLKKSLKTLEYGSGTIENLDIGELKIMMKKLQWIQ